MKVKIIPHSHQRYNTVGDYQKINHEWVFTISCLSKRRYEWLVLVHEIIECYLCALAGIPESFITDFDLKYEKTREFGDHTEPGDCPTAPYFKQHQIATKIEKILAKLLFVNWSKYSKEVESL